MASILTGRTGRAVRAVCDGDTLEIEWPDGGSVRQTGEAEILFEGDWPLPWPRWVRRSGVFSPAKPLLINGLTPLPSLAILCVSVSAVKPARQAHMAPRGGDHRTRPGRTRDRRARNLSLLEA